MIYVTMVVEDGADVSVCPGQIVSVSRSRPVVDEHDPIWYVTETQPNGAPDSGALFSFSELDDAWIPHTGTECPVHPLDVVRIWFSNHESNPLPARSWKWDDVTLTHYRHVTGSDGIPYVYDDGDLPEWAEYVATDRDGAVTMFTEKPWADRKCGNWDTHALFYLTPEELANVLANTAVHWTKTLRRVYR